MFLICGEALFDFFQDGKGTDAAARYDARIGGSPFNVALGLARLGAETAFFTGISNDMFGKRIVATMKDEGIADWAISRLDAPTTLSFVGLDAEGSPSYVFLGNGAADRSLSALPAVSDATKALHFGSFSLVVGSTAQVQIALAERETARFISLDPNIRPTIEPDMGVWREMIERYLPHTNLIKVSSEDLQALVPGVAVSEVAAEWRSKGPEMVIVTDGGNGVTAYRDGGDVHIDVTPVEVIDAVGAGDTFMAATLYQLGLGGDPSAKITHISDDEIAEMLRFSATAAAITCQRIGADLPDLKTVQSAL